MGLPEVLPQPFTLWRGDRRTIVIRWKDGAGAPVDMTPLGQSWTSAIRARPSNEVVATIDVDTSNLTGGEVVLRLTAEDTRLPGPLYGFDVQTDTEPGNAQGPLTIVTGLFKMDGDYTP